MDVSGFNFLLKGRGSDGIFKIQLYMFYIRYMLKAKWHWRVEGIWKKM